MTPKDPGAGVDRNSSAAGQVDLDIEGNKRGFRFRREQDNLFYTVQGSGDPVLLLHGWACDQSDWIFQIPFLRDHGFQVIALDQRGHGRSSELSPPIILDNSISLRYDPQTLADDAAAILQYLGVGGGHDKNKTAIVIGHSLGGVVAAELAYRHQRLVRGIVLLDPAYYGTQPQTAQILGTLKASPGVAPELAADSFEAMEASVPNRPSWMGAWRRQRTWGMPAPIVVATFEQLTRFLGNWSAGIDYMKERKVVPRLATSASQDGADIEISAGLGEEDRVETILSGHWHHQIDPKRFNSVLEEWFQARGYLPAA